jgi:polyketide synthase PksN
VAGDGFLYQKPDEQLHRVLRPKMLGAMTLYEALQGQKPDCFVMYSSMQTAMGGAGQGDYTAANTFMNAYAEFLRAQDFPAYAICWPAWSEVGMAADYQVEAGTMLFAPLSPRQAMAALESVLSHDIASLIPGRIEPEFLLRVGEENLPFALSKRLSANLRAYGKQASAPAERTAHNTENLQILGKETFTETEIRTAHIYAAVLNLDEIDIYAGFNSLGGNSIIATDLIEVLNGAFDNLLNVSDIFSYPSVEEMAAHIDDLRGQNTKTAGQEDILARFESGDLAVDEMLDYFKDDEV